MKPVLLLLAFTITLFSNAQNTYVPDYHINVEGAAGKEKIIDYVNDRVLGSKLQADEIVTSPYHGLLGFRKGSKYGLLNFYGKIIVPAVFDAYGLEEDGLPIEFTGDYFAVRKGETIGLIDSTGKFVVPLDKYDQIWDAKSGFGAAERNGLFGLFKNGKNVLPMEYNAEYFYYSGRFEFNGETEIILKGEFSGLINKKAIIVQPVKFLNIEKIPENYWVLNSQDAKSQLADSTGKILGNQFFTKIESVDQEYILAQIDTKYGVGRLDGTTACPFEYDQLGNKVKADAVFVKQNNKWGIYNLKKPKPVSFDFDNKFAPFWIKSGLAAVQINGLWGLADSNGRMVHKAVFENEGDPLFYEGYAAVVRNGKTGILTSTGQLIVPCEYEKIDPHPYQNQVVQKNKKKGLLSGKFELIIPCEYDELELIQGDQYLVRSGKKVGVYQIQKGLIVPVEFDEITLFNDYFGNEDYFQTRVNQQIGFVDQEGKTMLPNIAETVFRVDSLGALLSTNGQLKKYSLKTGKELSLLPDSVRKFESTSFVYSNSRWYCISNADKKIIGPEYSALGQFDAAGRVAAYPSASDYPIAINSKGEELNPGFHLIVSPVLDTVLQANEPELIAALLAKKQLIDPNSAIPVQQQIEEKLVLLISPFEVYDEFGYETGETRYGLYCYDKKNYFDPEHSFPAEPIYEFNFSDHYANWGDPNAEGWRWANTKGFYTEDKLPFISKYTVLVNSSGKEVRYDNYIPVNSLPFMEYTFNQNYRLDSGGTLTLEMTEALPWDSLGKFPDLIDSIKTYFPAAGALTTQQFVLEYKDSIHVSQYPSWTYVPEMEEIQSFVYSFYKTSGLQLFAVPPPAEVKYRFVLAEPKKLKGGEDLRETDIPFIQAMSMDEKTAFAFGNLRYFASPKFAKNAPETIKNTAVQGYLKDPEYRLIKSDLQNRKRFERLIETGLAQVTDIGYKEDSLTDFLASHSHNLQFYAYPANVGLAMENELLLPPNYLAIATDNSTIGKMGTSTFLVIDSLEQVWRYDLASKKLIADKNILFIGITRDGIITQHKETKLYGFNNFGTQLNGTFDESIRKMNFIPNMNDIRQLQFTGNCEFYPIMNMYGEDSILYLQDGIMEFVYFQSCDTNVMGKYGKFQGGLDLHAYQQVNQPAKFYFLHPANETCTFTKTSIDAGLPLNHHADGDYIVEETDKGLRLVLDNRILDIPEKDYFSIREIPKLSNGFGGIYRKGKFIPYQTLLAFPEKHPVNIHLQKSYYLVGKGTKLELVKLNRDQTLVKSGVTFTSGPDMQDQFYNNAKVRNSIQEFMGSDAGSIYW